MGAPHRVPVAITGMSVLLPGAAGLPAYWRNLVTGQDAITDVPASRWDPGYYPDPVYCRRGGFVDDLARLDPARFGIMPASLPAAEPDQLIALSVAADALADAGGQDRLPDRDRIGVILGRGGYLTPGLARHDQRTRTAHQLARTLADLLPGLTPGQLGRIREAFTHALGPDLPQEAIGLVPNLAASRVANRLDLRGPAYTVDAACASSLIALDHALGLLAGGRCDLMLAGGVHHCHDITLWTVFSQLGALSPTGRSRPFHTAADGILIGEGTGIVVLKRLADAQRDNDRVYAVIAGTGTATDGRTTSLAAPDPAGQARAVRHAWRAAGLDPRAPGVLGLLEAHGTGTPAGDAAELATLADIFGPPHRDENGHSPVIGSVKSMIGHTMPAAGAAGLIKAALALHHGMLLPTLHCETPHPALARTRFRALGHAEAWESPARRAAVNAFGFGGINAHVILESAPAPARPASPLPIPRAPAGTVTGTVVTGTVVTGTVTEPERVLRLTAGSPGELARLLAADDAAVRAGAEPPTGPAGGCRLAVVGPTAKRLALARRAIATGRAWRGRNDVWFSPAPLLADPRTGRLAFVFPGLEAEFAPRGVAAVARHFGLPAPAQARAGTGDVGRHAVGVLALGRLLDAALRRMGITPQGVAGHSVGEWAAMRAGGLHAPAQADELLASFDPDALRVPGLAFAAIGAPAERVSAALGGRGDVVLSHDNSPRQSMICGPGDAVDELVAWFRSRRVLAQVLPFQSGFHTPMLAPYLGQFTEGANRLEIRPPRIPVWSGTTASPFPARPAAVRKLFLRHLLEPVRFRPLLEAMYAAGFRVFLQAGMGQLCSLINDTLDGSDHLAIAAASPHRDGLAQLRRVAAALWTEGAAADPVRLRPVTAAARRPPAGGSTRLDLGSALVSLDEGTREALRGEVRAALGADGPGRERESRERESPERELDAVARRFPAAAGVAAELRAALADAATAAASAVAVLADRRRDRGRPAAGPGATLAATLRVSTEAMPYLRDHCFIPQREGWPDMADRRPVVPATTIVHHLADLAERQSPGLRAVAVRDVRLMAWAGAEPAVDVELTAEPRGQGQVAASFGRYASAVIELAGDYPAPPPPPAAWQTGTAAERPCRHAAAELYRDRWMFHGPAFQGVAELTAIGERHVRGLIRTPPAPGALLDNVGQLLGYWTMATQPRLAVIFPVSLGALRFFGPHPPPGTPVECHVRVTSVTGSTIEADALLTTGGRVWAEVTGWRDRRFSAPDLRRTGDRPPCPERRAVSVPQPGGWSLLVDDWPDLASRELVMHIHLSRGEREEYARHPPRGRRQWLLGRIAAKDAVRQWLWDQGEGDVFPAEIRVGNDAAGRPWATGRHGRRLPPLALSLAHRGRLAVALVRPGAADAEPGAWGAGVGGAGVGIDVEEITERGEGAVAFALGGPERALLAERCAATGEPAAAWFTRFWVAKEAVAKARGTGLLGRPGDFAVVAAEPDALVVEVGGRRHRVRCARVCDGAAERAREYVVGWTAPAPHDATNDEESSE